MNAEAKQKGAKNPRKNRHENDARKTKLTHGMKGKTRVHQGEGTAQVVVGAGRALRRSAENPSAPQTPLKS